MDYFYVFTGMSVSIIALFKRELLIQRDSLRIIMVLSVVLFFAGLVIHFSAHDRDSFCGALLSPLLSLGLYHLCHRVFLMRFKREPRDTYLNWQCGLAADRLFNIVYFALAISLQLVCMGVVIALAKAGW